VPPVYTRVVSLLLRRLLLTDGTGPIDLRYLARNGLSPPTPSVTAALSGDARSRSPPLPPLGLGEAHSSGLSAQKTSDEELLAAAYAGDVSKARAARRAGASLTGAQTP
jgi:hypothetical protein